MLTENNENELLSMNFRFEGFQTNELSGNILFLVAKNRFNFLISSGILVKPLKVFFIIIKVIYSCFRVLRNKNVTDIK